MESYANEPTGPIFLDYVMCSGTEQSLESCITNKKNDHQCEHSDEVLHLFCFTSKTTLTFRSEVMFKKNACFI